MNVERSTADTKKISPVQSLCRVVTSVTHDSPSRSPFAVWCSAADAHLKLLDHLVSGAIFLIGM